MGKSPGCSKDQGLNDYIKTHGEGKWGKIPKEAGK